MQDPGYRARHSARSRAWTAANPKATATKTRRWKLKNPQKVRAAREQWLAANPDYSRKWYQRNIETERARARKVMRRDRLNHPKRERERRRRYRENNIETVRARERENTQRRRALKGTCSPRLAELMAALVREPCAYCGATENITIDHIVPLSRDGRHEASNLAPACYSCNASKCNLLLSEWSGRRTAA